MQKILVDTSVIIEHTRTKAGILLNLQRANYEGKCELLVPSVVWFEFWAGKSMSKPGVVTAAENIFSTFQAIDLTPSIAKQAEELKRKGLIGDIDAIIAATALDTCAQLATLNTKHFAKIPGIKLWKGKAF